MRKPAASTKERLLAIARDVYLEVGPERLSLREVARRSGVTAAAVYRHYESKEALVGAVCGEGFRVFGSYLMLALRKPKPMERLRESGAQYLRFGLERPRDYRVIFMTDSSLPRKARADQDTPDPTFQFLVDRVRECMDAKVLRRTDPTEVAVTIWAHVHGLVSLRLEGHLARVGDDEAFAVFFTESTDRVIAGLRA